MAAPAPAPAPPTTVVVPYRDWIGYNILRWLSQYPLISSAVIGALSALIAWTTAEHDQGKIHQMGKHQPWQLALLAGLLTFAISYLILWYYGSTLFV